MISGLEGHISTVTDIGDGVATIGYGYTFSRNDNVSLWQSSGITLTASELGILQSIDQVGSNAEKTAIALNSFNKTLSLAEAQQLLKITFPAYENVANVHNMPESFEKVALVSITYNRGAGAVNSKMVDFLTAIDNGDRAEAWYQIRYNAQTAIPEFQHGIANRRYAEAETFGLYDRENISLAEAKSVLQVFTKHKSDIETYETNFPVPSDSEHGGVTGIEDYKGEFEPAKAVVVDALGIQGEVSLDDIDLLIDYIPEGSGGEEGTELLEGDGGIDVMLGGAGNDTLEGNSENNILEGGAGNDTLEGGAGNDQLQGGEGNDTYAFSGSYDHDTIEDSDGVGSIVIDGTTIDGQATLDTTTGQWVLDDHPNYYLTASGEDMVLHKTGDTSNTVTIKDFETGEDRLGNENNFYLLFYSVLANDNERLNGRKAA